MNSALLKLLEDTAASVTAGKIAEGDALPLLRRLVHGPIVGLVVKLTPNPVDDLIMAYLRAAIPAK